MSATPLAAVRPTFRSDLLVLLPDLRAFSRFLCRDRAAADDLAQTTVVVAMSKEEQYQPGTNLKAWLFTIMRSRFYSSLRTARRRGEVSEPDEVDNAPAPDHANASSNLIDLSKALWRIVPEYREALMLVGACGFSYEEAAGLCECSIGTMKARVSRARSQLGEALNPA